MIIALPLDDTALFGELTTVSDSLRGEKSAKEKGFSVGLFDAAYLDRFQFALLRHSRAAGAAEFSLRVAPLAALSSRSVERMSSRVGLAFLIAGGPRGLSGR